jgi:hypothetical protein
VAVVTMPVAVADGEHPEPAEDEKPVEEMEIGDASLPIDVDTDDDGQVEEVDGSKDTNGAMGRHGTTKITVAHRRHGTTQITVAHVPCRGPKAWP